MRGSSSPWLGGTFPLSEVALYQRYDGAAASTPL